MNEKKTTNGPLFILMINMFIAMVGMGMIIPLMPMFITEFGATGKDMGYLMAAFGLTQFIFSPLGGDWSDKYGRKKMIVIGMAFFTISQVLFAVTTDLWVLYLSRLLGGAGVGLMSPPMTAFIADVTTEDQRAKGLGWLGAAMSLGIVIGPGIGGYLADFGMRVPFYTAAALAGLSTLISIAILPETLTQEAKIAALATKQKRENIVGLIINSFKAPYFVLLLLVFVLTFGLMNFETVFGLFVDVKHGFTPQDISLIFTFGALAGVIIQAVVFGKLVEKFGEQRVIHGSLMLAAICMFSMTFVGQYAVIFTTTLLFFIATSLIRPAANTLLSKMAGNEQGYVAGLNNAFMSLGNIIGPSIAGILFDVNMSYPYWLGGVVLIVGSLMLAGWQRSRAQFAKVG
ncbi:MFS transporter [Paenibacillus agilis]|uniref:MFS transporter n=1 Tax=Paenibacillus agilis TaxID=3020863 RepID=A0A559IVT6_9BACL|nr:MFS transporter [Paenibacillus agilis]TVX91755.1 MFS transporter [Paenibacillus agilis]